MPVLRIDDYATAVEHYVDWLGITLDWEWREAEGQPVIMSMSRDGFSFFLSEVPEYTQGAQIHLRVNNLEAYVEELNARRPGSAKITIAPPYEFPNMAITDPFGNTLHFEGQDEAAEQRRRRAVRPKMKKFVQDKLNAGQPFPTPEEVRDTVGPPLGTAIEVLNEFPGYREAYETRQKSATPRVLPSSSHGLPSHLDLSVSDVSESIRFYDVLLTGLAFSRFRDDGDEWQEPNPTRAAWGRTYPNGIVFGIDLRPATSNVGTSYDRASPGPHHLALNADTDEHIDLLHEGLVKAGATVLDPPANYGGQPGYGQHYYAAFYADPDGFKVEIVNARGVDA